MIFWRAIARHSWGSSLGNTSRTFCARTYESGDVPVRFDREDWRKAQTMAVGDHVKKFYRRLPIIRERQVIWSTEFLLSHFMEGLDAVRDQS